MKRVLYVGNKLSKFGYTPTGIDFLGEFLHQNGFVVLYAGEKKHKVVRFWSIIMSVLLKKNLYDIILIDVYSSIAFYFAVSTAWMAKMLGKPYVLILRGGNLPSRLYTTPYLIKNVFRNAYKVVSVSHFLREKFLEVCHIDYIPNFIEIEKYSYKQRQQFTPRLLWVRSLHKIYNPKLAIEIVYRLKNEYPNVYLTMVGPDKDGSMTEVINLIKELELENHVRLTGKLTKSEWIGLAEDHDFFINTTNFDNMPVSVIEAMALGLPIISTNVGGIPYLIDHLNTGYLVDKDNVDAFYSAIIRLITDQNLTRTISEKGKEKIKEFDRYSVLSQWKQILNDN